MAMKAETALTLARKEIDNKISEAEISPIGLDSTLTDEKKAAPAGVVGDKITELKSDIVDLEDVIKDIYPIEYKGVQGGYLNLNGIIITTSNGYVTDYIDLQNLKSIKYTAKISDAGLEIAFYNENKEFINDLKVVGNGYENTRIIDLTDESYVNARYAEVSSYNYIPSIKTYGTTDQYDVKEEVNKKLSNGDVSPESTTFFKGINYYDIETSVFYNDRYVNNSGYISSDSTSSIMFKVEPNTQYCLYVPNSNRSNAVESSNYINMKNTYSLLSLESLGNRTFRFTTGNDTKYILFYIFNDSSYDYETNKNGIILNKGDKLYNEKNPFLDYKYSKGMGNLQGANILIFGDSITDCCNFTINSDKQTTSYSWNNPSNSYKKDGKTISYSMWAKILNDLKLFGEIRNYAKAGATYKTSNVTSGNERQNLHYQIDVALNDLSNPNNAFSVNNFVPDIVIFSLGTNDGLTPNDTYESAMNKSFDELDETKFNDSVRKAYMRIKQEFPMAQIFVSLPIQRKGCEIANSQMYADLRKMAQRYGCVVIDGANEFGIVNDYEVSGDVGVYLKDGLHPNDKGQNLMARGIIKSLESHYVNFNFMNVI